MKLNAGLQKGLRRACTRACPRTTKPMYTPTLQLDEQGVKVEEEIALEMFKTFGCTQGDFDLTRSYVEQFKQGPTGTACGKVAGRTSKHWHRSAVLMVNLGDGKKHWTVSSVQNEERSWSVDLMKPVRNGSVLHAHVLYLPPHFNHEVESEPNSLAVHTFFMPQLLHQHPDATIWATSFGAQEQAKVLQGEYGKWKLKNNILERHVKEGGGGGHNKRARGGDGSDADVGAPSKKPAAQVTAEEAEAMSLLPSLFPT